MERPERRGDVRSPEDGYDFVVVVHDVIGNYRNGELGKPLAMARERLLIAVPYEGP